MSKQTRKCPHCGAKMPLEVKYCRKCHGKMTTGRIEDIAKPVAYEEPVNEAPVSEEAAEGAAFFDPDTAEESGRVRPERRGRMGAAEDGPRPTNTARTAGDPVYTGHESNRSLWQIVAVLAIILAIIVVAVVLIIRLNSSGAPGASEPFEPNHINTSTEEPPAPAEATATPEPTPTATPTPTPTTPPVTITVTPSPSPSPTPPPTGIDGISVTPVNDTVYISGDGVNIRKGPGTGYDRLGSENKGYRLDRTGRAANGWSQVQYKGQTAYVSDSLLTTTDPTASTPAPTTNNNFTVTEASGDVTATSAVNVRSGPGTGYSILGVLQQGTTVTRTGTTGGWTRVNYNGQTGYVSTNYLTNASGTAGQNVTAESGTLTVTGSGVNIRKGPSTSYEVIGNVSKGTTLTVTGKSGQWYQVSYNNQTGYIIETYVSKN